MQPILAQMIEGSCRAIQSLQAHEPAFAAFATAARRCLGAGGKILTCGNGGSAADALHLAEELVGRYKHERRSLPAVCLNSDPTLLTCIGNDYGFDALFARQLESLAGPDDLLVVFTTSGRSTNILRALETARERGLVSVALLGRDGGPARGLASIEIVVEGPETAHIQEAHTVILHALLETIEADLAGHTPSPS